MSYDLTLQKAKENAFDFEAFRANLQNIKPLSAQEMIFADDLAGDSTEFILYEVKYDPKTNQAFLKYLKEKGIKVGIFDRLFRRVDQDQALEFYQQYRSEPLYEDILTVFADPSNEEEFNQIFQQLKALAQQYDLVIDDPQLGGLLDVEADEPRLNHKEAMPTM